MYKIHFVNDEDFERLPAQDIQTKLGVAYPETGEAFVRQSGSNVVDVFTAMHELEHLQGNDLHENYDDTNKCYYKDFGQIAMSVAPFLGTMLGGPAGGAIGSAGSQLAWGQGGIGQHMGLPGAPKKPEQQPQQNVMSQFMPQQQGPGQPNVIQAPGGAGQMGMGGGMSASQQSAGLPNTNDDPFGQFGRQSGR